MSVFYHNDDPLLQSTVFQSSMFSNPTSISDTYAQMYKQQMMKEMQQQQQPFNKDWLSELDTFMKNMDAPTVELLNGNNEFNTLNTTLQSIIQNELISLVKFKINTNDDAITNIRRQIEIMKETSQKVRNEQNQNMNELNDYLKNYSHLTFDEYRRLKNGQTQQTEEMETVVASDRKIMKKNKNLEV